MICHGSSCRFHNAVRIDTVMRGDGFLQRRIAVVVVTIDFECLQMDWQFTERKGRYAARSEIESRAALRLGPMHVVRMFVCHKRERSLTVKGEKLELMHRPFSPLPLRKGRALRRGVFGT